MHTECLKNEVNYVVAPDRRRHPGSATGGMMMTRPSATTTAPAPHLSSPQVMNLTLDSRRPLSHFRHNPALEQTYTKPTQCPLKPPPETSARPTSRPSLLPRTMPKSRSSAVALLHSSDRIADASTSYPDLTIQLDVAQAKVGRRGVDQRVRSGHYRLRIQHHPGRNRA